MNRTILHSNMACFEKLPRTAPDTMFGAIVELTLCPGHEGADLPYMCGRCTGGVREIEIYSSFLPYIPVNIREFSPGHVRERFMGEEKHSRTTPVRYRICTGAVREECTGDFRELNRNFTRTLPYKNCPLPYMYGRSSLSYFFPGGGY